MPAHSSDPVAIVTPFAPPSAHSSSTLADRLASGFRTLEIDVHFVDSIHGYTGDGRTVVIGLRRNLHWLESIEDFSSIALIVDREDLFGRIQVYPPDGLERIFAPGVGVARELEKRWEQPIQVLSRRVWLEESDFNLRRATGIRQNDVLLTVPGSIDETSGVLEGLRELDPILALYPDLAVCVVGPIRDARYGGKVLDLIRRNERFRFHGPVSHSEMQGVYRSSDIIFYPAHAGLVPPTLLEAAFSERPVVARRSPGAASVLLHGNSGFMYDSPADFQAAMEKLLDEPGTAMSLGKTARHALKDRIGGNGEAETILEGFRALSRSTN